MRRHVLSTTRPALAGLLGLAAAWPVQAVDLSPPPPISILFVGNSYTFGRTDGTLNPDGSLNLTNQVLTYNAAKVRDLTAPRGDGVLQAVSFVDPTKPFNANTNPLAPYNGAPFTNVFGTNSYPIGMTIPGTTTQGNAYSPHTQLNTWGGTAGIFKKFTEQAGLNYDVALSTRNAASLRGHLLNTANTTSWDLRSNIGSQKWDTLVLQEQSDEALGPRTTTTDFAGRPLTSVATLGFQPPLGSGLCRPDRGLGAHRQGDLGTGPGPGDELHRTRHVPGAVPPARRQQCGGRCSLPGCRRWQPLHQQQQPRPG